MNPLSVMTQIFIKGLFSQRSAAITNGTEWCQETGGKLLRIISCRNLIFFYRQDFLGSGMLTESLCQITTNQKTQTCELDVSSRRLHGGRGRARRTAR